MLIYVVLLTLEVNMSVMTNEIRKAVKVKLAEREMTQEQLAEKVSITRQQLSRMMQGKSALVPKSWQDIFDELGFELTLKPKGE
jgi:transcriptional regulator with XRE-family HTH domain